MSLDRVHLMTVFTAVVDASGFAGAARALNISAPAVTRAVAELENRLGVRLLTRTTRVVRLTEAGARYVEDCRRILAMLAEADDLASGSTHAPRGHLVVTAPVLLGAKVVTPIVTDYLTRYPDVTAACWFVDRVLDLLEEGVDVAVRIGEPADTSMQAERVGCVRKIVCASPTYLRHCGRPSMPGDLLDHMVISAAGVTPTDEWTFGTVNSKTVVHVNPRLTFISNEAAIAAAVSGFGVTRLLSYQASEELRSGQLEVVLAEHEPTALPVYVLHNEGRHSSPKSRAFVAMAIQALRQDPTLR